MNRTLFLTLALSAVGVLGVSLFTQDLRESSNGKGSSGVDLASHPVALEATNPPDRTDPSLQPWVSADASNPISVNPSIPVSADIEQQPVSDFHSEDTTDPLSVDELMALYESKQYQTLLDELRKQQYSDPFYIEDLFHQYLNASSSADEEKLWAFMSMLRDEAIAETLAAAITSAAGDELTGWLRVVPDTAAFSNEAVREPIFSILNESNHKDQVIAALGTLNPALAEGVDSALVTSSISRHMASPDADIRIAAYQQQARWFPEPEVKQALTHAFQDADAKVQIAAMSILETTNIKEESFRQILTEMLTHSEKGSDLYLNSLDTLVYYYDMSQEQLVSLTGDASLTLD